MSQEAIELITRAEEKARSIKSDAVSEAKRMTAQAQSVGKKAIDAAEKKAKDELRELVKKADEKATADAVALATTTENKKAAMSAKAELKLDEAASIIAERIVSSE